MSGLEDRLRRVKPTGGRYPIDIVFVVDATESMSSWLETVKFNVLRLGDDLRDSMTTEGKTIESLRVRLIVYRDIFDDPESAFELTPFFDLPSEKLEFERAVKDIIAFGGGDLPESGLEALFLAMRSPWRKEPRDLNRRHVVVLFTDADSHDIGRAEIPKKFAQEPHPKSFSDLKFLWDSTDGNDLLNRQGKRLLLFAPEIDQTNSPTSWYKVQDEWTNSIIVSDVLKGLSATEWKTVLSSLTASL